MKKTFIYLMLLILMVACNKQEIQINRMIELNKNWKLIQETTGNEYDAVVPGCVHTDLLNNNVIEDPFFRTNEKKQQWIDKEDWSYLSEFEVDEEVLAYESVELNFKGLDTYADVYLNDSLILKANNMFREWLVECENLLKPGKNKLRVYFHSPINIGLEKLKAHGYALPASNDQSENGELGDKKVSIFTRKAPYHYGWDWGPRFVTSGIWRPVYLKVWNKAKINNIQIVQNELNEKEAKLTGNVSINSSGNQDVTIQIKNTGKVLYSEKASLKTGENSLSINYVIENPKLWWTKGLGDQHLYNISTSILVENQVIETKETTIGLRTIKLVQKPDEFGKSFYFELNGVPVFMKGANHIPNDIFLNRVTPEIYEREIKTAAESNMNMLRVWGGGIYEDDVFYDLCDKYGILVWQDFMFACSMYPGNEEFLANIKQEAKDNVIRLRNHPSIALWCGNNEIDVAWSEHSEGGWGWKQQYNDEQHKEIWTAYEKIFHEILPNAVNEYDPGKAYWPSSPMAGPKQSASYTSTSGDMHYWGVWHGKEPFSAFDEKRARFMSEYGFQSFPELSTVKKYALPEDFNIESEVMAAHQRSGIGNLRIKEYMSWYYKTPKDFETFLYVGQVLQAEGIKMGIEAHRRDMPYNMGTLYWQINDCWPVASWSSMDYYGKWKALQYFVKKAFEDVLISPFLAGDSVAIFIVSDKLENTKAKIKLELLDFEGNSVLGQTSDIEVIANSSKIYTSLPKKLLDLKMTNKNYVLLVSLYDSDKLLTSNVLYFDEIKDLALPKAKIEHKITKTETGFTIELSTDKLAKNVYLMADAEDGFFSDNYFDLLPERPVKISYTTKNTSADLEKVLKITSLVDSYQ
ncbi:MAG: glycoside hydrolase family 2 TIM barrel-domain containing protein [Bacteroidales bacterium]|nr:glycoside hydrolase family 2 TIM barrel-domain containing protein [Bacteroidales bacterium]